MIGIALLLIGGLVWAFSPKPSTPTAGVPASVSPTASVSPSPSVSPSVAQSSMSPSPSASTPSGPVACDPLSTKLSVTGFQSVKTKGKQTFSLGLTNNTAANCVLTLSPSTYVLKVSSGNDRIWTTADCTKLVPVKKTTLKPGASYEFKIDWTLKRSKPGCKLVDKELGAGTYVATASFQSSGNARFVMQLKK